MSPRASLFVSLAALTSQLAACDPVHSEERSALGGEAPGVHQGPLHRPGQPCTVCHDGALGDPSAFSVAGTIYEHTSDATGANGVVVTMTDSSGSTHDATTNEAGNFYLTPEEWTPKFPLVSTTIQSGTTSATMYSQVSWASSCSYCHTSPADSSSPGHISLLLDDGGTPL